MEHHTDEPSGSRHSSGTHRDRAGPAHVMTARANAAADDGGPRFVVGLLAVPMLGAFLNALNIRLDASAIAFMLDHGEAKVILTDRMFSGVIKEAIEIARNTPLVIDISFGLNWNSCFLMPPAGPFPAS